MLDKLRETISRLDELCTISQYPKFFCGKRRNCCSFSMISLFHEQKQMGLVLKRSFKGNHLWVPPIPQQIKEAEQIGMSAEQINKQCINYDKNGHLNPNVKIDAMFFAATEEVVDLQHKDDSKVEYL